MLFNVENELPSPLYFSVYAHGCYAYSSMPRYSSRQVFELLRGSLTNQGSSLTPVIAF